MKARDRFHETNHKRQAGPMKDRRTPLTEAELIEEQEEPRVDDRMDDNSLEWLIQVIGPGPLDGEGPLTWANRPRPFVVQLGHQALGILYEEYAISLVGDACYDRLGKWLDDSAATAMDWRDYPWQAQELAAACARAWKRRQKVGSADCSTCARETWGFPCDCTDSA
ncbi:MAG: hypothetical protein V3S01_06835 [Dehalococcoidia bacterium]